MILVAEDEPSVAEVISRHLHGAGYDVVTVADGLNALKILGRNEPELIVLDLLLPGVGGFAVTRAVRESNDTPIIMLGPKRDEVNCIAGLEMGADDYMVKPFSPEELVSRVRAILRRCRRSDGLRTRATSSGATRLVFRDLEINTEARTVAVAGDIKTLTIKEYELLLVLARRPHRVFSRDELLNLVWAFTGYIDPAAVTVHIHRLRSKIEKNAAKPEHIITARGIGYRFEP